ncbi:7-cyano-7-deazaguanine synthase [Undibacterium sp. Ji83W]|uniref:7-cyano-7-deazaguanine synthase n=1 Tax=Undibacterium sp. Ji83W TaxID=3413043 RepID=UPI003BF43A16
MKTALLLSGGMDSLSLAWWKKPDVAITLDYGQIPAQAEIAAATAICKRLNILHYVIQIDCRSLGSGDMAGARADPLAPASDWWPYRNQLLITLTAMKAIAFGVTHLWIGTVKSDGSHKDGTPEFIDLMNRLMHFQEGEMIIEAPAISLSTAELVKLSEVPSEYLAWAHSCHTSNVPCGECRGCNKYFAVFEELGYDLDRSR